MVIILSLEDKISKIKEELSSKFSQFDLKINEILKNPENKKLNDIKGFVDKYYKEQAQIKLQDSIIEKNEEINKKNEYNEKLKKKKIHLMNNHDKRLRDIQEILDKEEALDKSQIKRLTNYSYVSNRDKYISRSKSRSKSKSKEKEKKEKISNEEVKEVDKEADKFLSQLNSVQREFVQNLDQVQLKNFLDKKEKNISITKFDIDQHNKKIEEYKNEIELNKKLNKPIRESINENKLIKSTKIDVNKLQMSLIHKKEEEKKPNPEDACYQYEKELQLKKVKSLNIKIQKQKCSDIIKELVPVQPSLQKKLELEQRIKFIHSPKSKLEQMKLRAIEDPEFVVFFNENTGKPIVPDYLSEIKELNQKPKEKKKKKLEPIVYSPTTQSYKGKKSEKSVPRKKPDKKAEYITKSNTELYLNDKNNVKKWENIILKDGAIHQNLGLLRHSLNKMEEKIERNKKVLNSNTAINENSDLNSKLNFISARVSQEQGNLLVDSINAKLVLLNSLTDD